jgi:hypothetical protein
MAEVPPDLITAQEVDAFQTESIRAAQKRSLRTLPAFSYFGVDSSLSPRISSTGASFTSQGTECGTDSEIVSPLTTLDTEPLFIPRVVDPRPDEKDLEERISTLTTLLKQGKGQQRVRFYSP